MYVSKSITIECFSLLFQAKVKEKKQKTQAKNFSGLMTLQQMVRNSLNVQWGGGQKGQGATKPGDGGARENRWMERFVFRVKEESIRE